MFGSAFRIAFAPSRKLLIASMGLRGRSGKAWLHCPYDTSHTMRRLMRFSLGRAVALTWKQIGKLSRKGPYLRQLSRVFARFKLTIRLSSPLLIGVYLPKMREENLEAEITAHS